MSSFFDVREKPKSAAGQLLTAILRIVISVSIPAVTFLVLWGGFMFLRDSGAPQIVVTLVAIVWGVGGVAALFFSGNWLIQHLGGVWKARLTPFLFVGPAVVVMGWYLALPTARSLWVSFLGKYRTAWAKLPADIGFFSKIGAYFEKNWVGLENYKYVFTDRTMLTAFANNLIWLLVGTGATVLAGLLVALLADRSRMEKMSKSFIFLPMAISFVGAGVIWKFVYAYRDVSQVQIGLFNAVVAGLGGNPVNWLTLRPWNTLFLIIIFVWLQTGFGMVVFSAALKQVPESILEAARIDGAKEFRIVLQIVIPSIRTTIITVGTTILLMTLKVFDIVYAITNGLFGTEVLASQQFKQMFKFLHPGRGSAVAIVIFIAVIPVIWYNLRQFADREVF